MEYQSQKIHELCVSAVLNAGADEEMANSLATAIVAAQEEGKGALGILHFFDYLDSIREQRINAQAKPVVRNTVAAVFAADADQGIPHVAFDRVFKDLVLAAQRNGIAIFSQKNSYTCGALGYFAERLARQGLVCIAATNSTAHLAAGGSSEPVFGTNPLAFAVPLDDGKSPLIFDQASSQTALVSIREAARNGESIPEGWAVDGQGHPTTDAASALLGALLPFGGYKGGNIALMVEMLATMSGASWSLDAGLFDAGGQSPNVGMFIIALDPMALDPDFSTRVSAHLDRLRTQFGMKFPGESRRQGQNGICQMEPEVFSRLTSQAVSGNHETWANP